MTTTQQELIRVHQTLHGYADGHRLIASSGDFGREANRVMVVLSDMSGPTMIPGFESYLTSYPLSDDLYVIARTWYAPEMSRPGCVWTHSLLLGREDVGRIRDIERLITLFARPAGNSFDEYRKQLTLSLSTERAGHAPFTATLAAQLVANVYQDEEHPVFLLADHGNLYEQLIVALWAQQWPALRRAFSFCTGSLASRKLQDRPLDIQVIPGSRTARFRRSTPAGNFVDLSREHGRHPPRWAFEAAIAMFASRSPFGDFLWGYADDVEARRANFAHLSSAYVQWKDVNAREVSATELVDELGSLFPHVEQARRLKKSLLDRSPYVAEQELIEGLVNTRHAAAFDPDELGLKERAGALWDADRTRAERLVVSVGDRRTRSALAEVFLDGAAQAMAPKDALRLAAARANLMATLVARNLTLAKSPAVWAADAPAQETILAQLRRRRLSRRDRKSIARAMVRSGNSALPAQVVGALGGRIIEWILDALNEPGTLRELPEYWMDLLQHNSSEVTGWFERARKLQPSSAVTLALLLDPESAVVRQRGTMPWLRFLCKNRADSNSAPWSDLMVFLLALGFINPDDHSVELVARVLQPVHDAAEAGNLSYAAWKRLEPFIAKRTSWGWRREDRLDRLRRGLADRFANFQWPVEQFVRCFQRPETFRQTLQSSRGTSRDYLYRGLKKLVDVGVAGVAIEPDIEAEIRGWAKRRLLS